MRSRILNGISKGLRSLLVDDEPLARDALLTLLETDPDIGTVAQAANVEEALLRIQRTSPHLIFLDVKMPGGDGFSLLRRLQPGYNPAIVFVTAFADYAVPAFDINAVDYLLKPVTRERFRIALRRVKSRMEVALEPDRPRYLQRIAVPTGEGVRFIKIQEVEWFEAEENYIRIHGQPKTYLLHATMNRLVESLDPQLFMRVHRSAVVKIDSIREIRSLSYAGEYGLTLANGAQVRTGRTYRESLRALLSNFK